MHEICLDLRLHRFYRTGFSGGQVPIYGAPIDLDVVDIEVVSEDVVYAGEFAHPNKCQIALQMAAHLYMLHYND